MITGKKILITGGAGFIGSNLCDHFISKNNHIICLDNLSTGKLSNIEHLLGREDFKFIEGDIRYLETCQQACLSAEGTKAGEGVDYILHQAALGSVPRSINDPITTNSVKHRRIFKHASCSTRRQSKTFCVCSKQQHLWR